MLVLNKIYESLLNYPVAWATLTRSAVLCIVAFGYHLTSDQIASLMLVVEAALGVVTHQNVSPVARLNKDN